MKKYVIAKTGEEVNFGDIVATTCERVTSFGSIKSYEEFTLTPVNIKTFIENGVIKVVEEGKEPEESNLGYYINIAAKKLKCTKEELIEWLEKMNKVCPKAVFDFLLHIIAIEYYKKDLKAFGEAKAYYSLKPKDGEVGRVNITSAYIPLFKSREDAEEARKLLKDQLDLMYGKQKSC